MLQGIVLLACWSWLGLYIWGLLPLVSLEGSHLAGRFYLLWFLLVVLLLFFLFLSILSTLLLNYHFAHLLQVRHRDLVAPVVPLWAS